jgi:hypothetical protein
MRDPVAWIGANGDLWLCPVGGSIREDRKRSMALGSVWQFSRSRRVCDSLFVALRLFRLRWNHLQRSACRVFSRRTGSTSPQNAPAQCGYACHIQNDPAKTANTISTVGRRHQECRWGRGHEGGGRSTAFQTSLTIRPLAFFGGPPCSRNDRLPSAACEAQL